jgi:hypothetical protein
MGIVKGAGCGVRGAGCGARGAKASRSLPAALLIALGMLSTVAPLAAQTVQTDPLQCWWRTSSGAIRVGQTFQVVLTCAVLETEAATVVVDQTRLEPSVLQFPPFEVMGGAHGADLRTEDRHFFQYEYRLRLIAENMFGKDVQLPELKINYRVQSKVSQNTSLQGRDQAYMMPAASVRVLSLVPSDASDIRDSTTETFSDLDQRALRANLFVVVGTVLFVLAGLLAILALVRVFARFRKPATVTQRMIADSTILRGVSRELSALKRARNDTGWTTALAARALSAMRIIAAFAIDRKVGHMPAAIVGTVEDGRLIMNTGWPRTKRIAVSGSITPQVVGRAAAVAGTSAGRQQLLTSLEQALQTLTAAGYGRSETLDDGALDQALETGVQALRNVRIRQLWFLKRWAAWRAGTAVDNRAWSR